MSEHHQKHEITYEVVCWTCGLERSSLTWARKHARTGWVEPDMRRLHGHVRDGKPHTVRVTKSDTFVFNCGGSS